MSFYTPSIRSLFLSLAYILSLIHVRTHARTHTSTPAHPHPNISTHARTRARCKHTHISIRYRCIHFPSLPFLFLSSLPPLPLHSSFLKHTIDLANESNRDKLNYYSGVHQHPFCTAALRLNKNSHLSLSPAPYPRYLSGEDPVLGGTLVKPLIDGIQNHVMVSFPSKTCNKTINYGFVTPFLKEILLLSVTKSTVPTTRRTFLTKNPTTYFSRVSSKMHCG